jgi:hypothetical protein
VVDVSEDRPPGAVDRRPTRLGSAFAVVGGVVVVITAVPVSGFGLLVGATGVAATGGALALGSRRTVDLGGLLLLLATVLVGAAGSAPLGLTAGVGAVFAWDQGTNAVEMGRQMGTDAPTDRAELVHAGATLTVGVVTAVFAFVVYRLAGGGQPTTALVSMLLAAVVILSALRV